MTTGEPDLPRDYRAAAIAGLLSLPIGIAAALIDEMWRIPPTATTSSELLDFAASNRAALMTGMVLNTTAVTLWLVFGAGVWAYLRVHAPNELVRSTCFGAGLISFVTMLFAGFTAFFVLVYRAPLDRDALLLYDLTFGLLAMSGAPTAVALWSYAEIVFRIRVLRRSTAVLAAVGAASHLALLASLIVRDGLWSLQGPMIVLVPGTLMAWIVATSIAMMRAPRLGPVRED